ncbi:MAG TPA: MFS transporter [Fermentimonas sp.]|nr:MFS transporter [Fermentimonas sp.]
MTKKNKSVIYDYFPWVIMILMSSVTFVGILSELMPSGVLPQIMADLGINEIQGGNLVGYYAIASAIFAIPLISATMQLNRKVLLLILLAGFSISNVIAGVVHNYYFIIVMRLIGGVCAGVMWPMIAAFGMRLVEPNQHGKAVAVIMAGNTLGISIGMPIMTYLGNTFGWRNEFIILGVVIAVIGVLSIFMLPSTPGEKLTQSTSPFAVFKNKGVLMVLLLTLLGVCAHYGVYVYITNLVSDIDLVGGIEAALVMFGIGSLISVMLAVKYTDKYLQQLTVLMFVLLALSMALFIIFRGTPIVSHIAFFFWGLSFGPLVTLFQAAVARQVEQAKDVATSVQSSTFNFSIMIATSVGGVALINFSALSLPALSILLAIPGIIISLMAKRTLK